KRAYCLKTQPATGETYPKSDLFNKAGGALNPFAGLVKGAQLGYDTGASIMGMVGGVVGGVLGGAMGFLGALVGSYN
ncbi:hypothetical protein VBJ93_13710, partial [Enterobacter hormaechei]|nr:hypothetical protein [Enterobacter hormaechei]